MRTLLLVASLLLPACAMMAAPTPMPHTLAGGPAPARCLVVLLPGAGDSMGPAVARTQPDDLPDDPPDVNPPASPPRPAVALTEGAVATRLATRAAKIKAECAVPWLVLDLAIERGQATLATINGMPFTAADPIHACVRTQLHGLRFPRADTRAEFSLTIDLSKEPR